MKRTSNCLDCKKNTDALGEYYMVHNRLWGRANPKDKGMLCIGCLENRIGRKLKSTDFTFCPLNAGNFFEGSERLQNRMGNTHFACLPRDTQELQNSEEVLSEKVWYNRHLLLRQQVDTGKIAIVEKYDKNNLQGTIVREIWEGALKAGKQTEKKYKRDGELGPYDDFEWGMLNGKLSTIRWVLGEDWDMLDT